MLSYSAVKKRATLKSGDQLLCFRQKKKNRRVREEAMDFPEYPEEKRKGGKTKYLFIFSFIYKISN
jgi:hypothetical protein